MIAQTALPSGRASSPRRLRWLLAAGLAAAMLMIALLVELIDQNIERGNHLRAEQRAHREALARHDPRPIAVSTPQWEGRADRIRTAAR